MTFTAGEIAARAGVTKDIPPGSFVSGFPAVPHDRDMRLHAMIARAGAEEAGGQAGR